MLISTRKSFSAHWQDMRLVLILLFSIFIIIFASCFYFAQDIFNTLTIILADLLAAHNLPNNFVVMGVGELFFSYLEIALFFSIMLLCPIASIIVLIYLIPVFRYKERKVIYVVFILIPVLFFLGTGFAYKFGMPVILNFFIGLVLENDAINFLPRVSEYISLVLRLLLIFGLLFELPIGLIVIALFGIIEARDILKYAKYAIVVAFIIGALFTPPDPLSQIIVASVFIALYYISYLIVRIIIPQNTIKH